MTTSIVASSVATTAAVNSSIAKTKSCKSYVNRFDSDTATVQEAQEYASCVNYLYPKAAEFSGGEIIALKACFILTMFVAVYAAYRVRGSYADMIAVFILSLVGVPALLCLAYFIFNLFLWVVGS